MNNLSKLSGVLVLVSAFSFLPGCESDGEFGGGGGGGGGVTTRTLIVAVNGNGTVTSDTGGIVCTSAGGATCSATYDDGTAVTLSAAAGTASVFTAWAGNCTPVSGSPSQCTITLNANETVLALFDTPVVGGLGDTVILTKSGTTSRLLTFNIAAPGTILSNSTIQLANGSPLPTGDEIVAIARRPVNGVLYGLAKTSDSGTGRLYVLNPSTGAATQVAQIANSPDAPFEMVGPEFGMHFDHGTVFGDPVDRLRIADGSGKIYDVAAGSGAVLAVDSTLASAVTALAATNAFVGTAKTVLYAIGDSTLSTLTLPNTLATVGGIGTTVPAANGFDIDAINGAAYVAFTGATGPELRSINLATGSAVASLAIGDAGIDAETVRGLALRAAGQPQVFGICGGVASETQTPPASVPTCVVGKTLIRFNASTPSTYGRLGEVGGLAGTVNEVVIGLAVKPSTKELFALTSDPGDPATADGTPATGRLYTLNLVTAAATFVSEVAPDKLVVGRIYGFGFDPVTEKARIIGGTADGDPANVTNFSVTTATGAVELLTAPEQLPFAMTSVAFDSNNAGATGATWYGIDSQNDRLFTIDAATDDLLANAGRISFVGNLSFEATDLSGFEIISPSQPPVGGIGYVTRGEGAGSFLNRIVITTGVSEAVGGAIGSLSGVSGQVVGLTATVNAGATTEMFVATTVAAPDAEIWGFDGGDPTTGEDPVPETLTTRRDITGLIVGETVLALDFQFANDTNTLYLLARGAGNIGRLYTVDTGTGAATPVGTTGDILTSLGTTIPPTLPTPYVLEGTSFGMDFDPSSGSLRIVSNTNENLSVDPNTALVTVAPDLEQTPLPILNALAFTNNFAGSTNSELLLLDTNTADDRVARLDSSQILSRSVETGVNHTATDEVTWDILGGHNGLSILSELACDDPLCTSSLPFTVLRFLDVSTDSVPGTDDGSRTVGVDDRAALGSDTRLFLNAMAARFPD